MFLLNTVGEGEAQGKIKEAYNMFPGPPPAPLQLLSASPGMFEHQVQYIQYYMNHKTLGFPLLTAIRYLSAEECGHEYCLDFNRGMLMKAGMSAEDLDAMKADPATAPLEDKEQAMLAFVARAVRNPKSVSQADVEALRAEGWTDSDILDALVHGAHMRSNAVIFNALQR